MSAVFAPPYIFYRNEKGVQIAKMCAYEAVPVSLIQCDGNPVRVAINGENFVLLTDKELVSREKSVCLPPSYFWPGILALFLTNKEVVQVVSDSTVFSLPSPFFTRTVRKVVLSSSSLLRFLSVSTWVVESNKNIGIGNTYLVDLENLTFIHEKITAAYVFDGLPAVVVAEHDSLVRLMVFDRDKWETVAEVSWPYSTRVLWTDGKRTVGSKNKTTICAWNNNKIVVDKAIDIAWGDDQWVYLARQGERKVWVTDGTVLSLVRI